MTSYLLRTSPMGELKAVKELIRLGIKAFVPTEKRQVRVSRHVKKKRVIEVPLTPRYVVASMLNPHAAIHMVDEITGVVETAGQTMLTARDVDALRRMDGSKAATVLHKSLAVGQAIIVRDGPLRDYRAVIDKIDGDRASIHLDILGKRTPIELPLQWLDPG